MKVKLNKSDFFIISKRVDANPILEIKKIEPLANDRYEVTIELGLNVSSCKKKAIGDFIFEVYNGVLTKTARSFTVDMKDGLNSTIENYKVIKEEIEKEKQRKLICKKKISLINLLPLEIYNNNSSKFRLDYYETHDSDIDNSDVINRTLVIANTTKKKIQDCSEFCLSMLRRKQDPALYSAAFPIADVTKKDIHSIDKIGEWSYTGEEKKYKKRSKEFEYYPIKFKFFLDAKVIDELTEVLTIKIFAKNFDSKIISTESFQINSRDITKFIKSDYRTTLTTPRIYQRKINKTVKSFNSPYTRINTNRMGENLDVFSKAFISRYENSLIRFVDNDTHIRSVCNVNRSMLVAQTINLFSANEIPFSILKQKKLNVIKLKFENVPNDIAAIGIERRDTTQYERFSKFSLPKLINQGSNVTFADSTLKNGHIYEYRPYYIDKKGHTKIAGNILQYHNKISSSNVELTLSNLKREVVQETNKNDVHTYTRISFDIFAQLEKQGFESIKEFLEKNNYSLGSLGINEKNYKAYKELFLYEITRQNITTGEMEYLGVSFNEQFVDNSASLSNTKNIKPLKHFNNYRYIVKVGLRSPSSLISTQYGKNLKNGTVVSYSFNSYKLSQKNLFGDKILLNSKNMNKIDGIGSNFMNHYIGIEASIESFVDTIYPIVEDLKVESNLLGYNLLSWKIRGDLNNIDHFRIYAKADGIQCFIAATHPHLSNESGVVSYFYKDKIMFDRLGEVTYTISPVLLNFNESPGNKSITIVKNSNLPTFLR